MQMQVAGMTSIALELAGKLKGHCVSLAMVNSYHSHICKNLSTRVNPDANLDAKLDAFLIKATNLIRPSLRPPPPPFFNTTCHTIGANSSEINIGANSDSSSSA